MICPYPIYQDINKLTDDQAVGMELRYFDLGDIDLFNDNGDPTGSVRPREFAIGGTYSRKLSEKLGVGVSLRFIHSNISQNNCGYWR